MDKGQHLRLFLGTTSGDAIGLAKELTIHLTAQVENITTKDTTDVGVADSSLPWVDNAVTMKSGQIQFGGLVDTSGSNLLNAIGRMTGVVNWYIYATRGLMNRENRVLLCSGQGNITNVQAQGPNRQSATFSGTINIVGAIIVSS